MNEDKLSPGVQRIILSAVLEPMVQEMVDKSEKVRSTAILITKPEAKLMHVEIHVGKPIGRKLEVVTAPPKDELESLPDSNPLRDFFQDAMCNAQLHLVCEHMKKKGELTRNFEIEMDLPDSKVETWQVKVEMTHVGKTDKP